MLKKSGERAQLEQWSKDRDFSVSVRSRSRRVSAEKLERRCLTKLPLARSNSTKRPVSKTKKIEITTTEVDQIGKHAHATVEKIGSEPVNSNEIAGHGTRNRARSTTSTVNISDRDEIMDPRNKECSESDDE